MFEKQPPTAPEAEMSLLGSLLQDPAQFGPIQPMRSGDFYNERHATIYAAFTEVYDRVGDAFDLTQLAARLRAVGAWDQIGGDTYLLELWNSTPTPVNAPHYAELVRKAAGMRGLIDTFATGLHESYNHADFGPEGLQEIADRAEGRIMAIVDHCKGDQTAGMESLGEILQAELERLADSEAGVAVPTHYTDLDHKLGGGLYPGDFIVIGARPSMGKTALAMNIAENIAAKGTPVGVLSMEMTRQALSHRLIANAAGVPLASLRGGTVLTDHELRDVTAACGMVQAYPLYIDDTAALSVTTARTKARRMVQRHGVRVVIVDYLQLMTAPGAKESRQVEVAAISRGLKALAKECRVPVIALAQLNRAVEARADFRPRMSDLRESGSLEQDADVVALLHREEYYHRADEKWIDNNAEYRGLAELILAKQRNGPTGTVKLAWNEERTRFQSAADGKIPPIKESRAEPTAQFGNDWTGHTRDDEPDTRPNVRAPEATQEEIPF